MSTLRLWIAGILTAIIGGLTIAVKIMAGRADKAVKRAEVAEENLEEVTEIVAVQKEISKVQQESREGANDEKLTTNRPTGSFGDKRLYKGSDQDGLP